MSRTDRTPRQRLNPQDRRNAILEAAHAAFANTPYDQVAVAKIAAESGSSEALLYRYYSSKAELYIAVVQQVVADLLVRQHKAAEALGHSASPRDKISATLDVFLHHLEHGDRLLLLPGNDPNEAKQARLVIRREMTAALRHIGGFTFKNDAPISGYLGFLDNVCQDWVDADCNAGLRTELVEASLGALFGAIAEMGKAPVRRNKFGNPI